MSRFASEALEKSSQARDITGAAHEVLAHAAYRAGDWSVAREHATAAAKDYMQIGSLAGIASCYRTLGLNSDKQSESETAIEELEVALEFSELLRAQVALSDTGVDRAGYFAKHAYTNERLIDLHVGAGNAERALEIAELAKARTLEDFLRSSAGNGEDDSEGEDGSDFLTVFDAVEMLDEGTLAVEYFVGAHGVYAFVISPDGEITAHRLQDAGGNPLKAVDLVGRVAGFLGGMERRASKMMIEIRRPQGFDKSWQNTLNDFYLELMPETARNALSDTQHLVVIPHHILHYFPFAALVTEIDQEERSRFQMPQPKFLVEHDLDITTAPSLTTYAWLLDSPSNVQKANAIGISEFEGAPELPGVETDLKNYEEVFADRVGRIVKEKPITEDKIQGVLAEQSLLFIGTHGYNDSDRPLGSFLLCDADEKTDGQLTASELFSSTISSDAIVMSACYSGLADRVPLPGDDLFGIQRAMLKAGAKSIVSGLWDVYDDTAPQLMQNTMNSFAKGNPLRKALADGQREFLLARKTKGPSDLWIHPYFWAVYRCGGSGHTVMSAN